MQITSAWERPHSDDAGFTLVEVVVSIFVLSIVLLALLSTIVSSLAAVNENEANVRANALGNELLERMAAQPWELLGLYVDEVPDSVHDGESVVLLPAASPRDERVPLPIETVPRDGRTYEVERWITWVDDADAPTTDQNYKRLVIELRWQVRGTERALRTQTMRAPNPHENVALQVAFTDVQNTESTIDGNEVALRRSDHAHPLRNAHPFDLFISVTDPDAAVQISFVDRDGARQTRSVLGGTERTLSIPRHDFRFRNGPVSFAVTAQTTGPRGETASNTETVLFFQELRVDTPQIRHADGRTAVCVDEFGEPVSELVLDVAVTGLTASAATSGEVTLSWEDDTLPLSPVASTVSGGTFRGVVPGPFTPGDLVEFRVTADRLAANAEFQTSHSAAVVAEILDETSC